MNHGWVAIALSVICLLMAMMRSGWWSCISTRRTTSHKCASCGAGYIMNGELFTILYYFCYSICAYLSVILFFGDSLGRLGFISASLLTTPHSLSRLGVWIYFHGITLQAELGQWVEVLKAQYVCKRSTIPCSRNTVVLEHVSISKLTILERSCYLGSVTGGPHKRQVAP